MNTDQLRMASLVLLAIFFGLYFYADKQQEVYDRSAKPEAARILKSISRWEKSALLEQLSEEARQTLNETQLEKLLGHYRQYGELQSVDELEFSKLVSALSLFGAKRINYKGTATYSTGNAQINITLVPAGNGYKVYNFTISR